MSTHNLDKLFAARSVALVGASPRDHSLGRTVFQQLRGSKFPGPLRLVNPNYEEIDGVRAVPSLSRLAEVPDVVVVTAPASAVPEIIDEAGTQGAAVAIVISAGLGHGQDSLAEQTHAIARKRGLRIVGPNGLGVLVPAAKLNASFAARMPLVGDLALISQSGAIAAGLIEWAAKRSIGFSAIVSVGDALDVDFGDLLDFFALDVRTRAILLYVESITDARKFMSAARAAARVKPVIVIKSGRHAQGARAAATHTGALAGSDAVYDAAFRRAGLLRVWDLDEMFSATESLARVKPFAGKRLAILTNGGGVGVLAVDRLMDLGGVIATLSAETRAALDAVLPRGWSRANPADIIGDADGKRYADALSILLSDSENDAVLVMNVPTALASAADAAQAVSDTARSIRKKDLPAKPLFAAWIGEDETASSALESASIPHFASEADAVQGFMHLVRYCETRDALMATPPSLPQDFAPDTVLARAAVQGALDDGRTWLNPVEVTRILGAYGIPAVPALWAKDPEAAVAAAEPWLTKAEAVVAKILSPDIVHKSDVGGVCLNLTTGDAVREATAAIMARAKATKPAARIDGVTIHPMIVRPKARELIAGVADDPTFGPVIAFGAGGTAVEIIADKALALPPLDMNLARELIGRTRVAKVLGAYRNVPAADVEALALVLVKIAQLVADIPEVRELDLNPLLVDENAVIAVDARIAVAPVKKQRFLRYGHPRFAIRPYPKEWERRLMLKDDSAVFVRPVRPEDEDMFRTFFTSVSEQDLRLRFFASVKQFSHTFIARLTQIDYARAMAFAAIEEASGRMLGVVRLHANPNHDIGEFAVLVRSDLKGRGLGWMLMQLILEYARAEGLQTVEGQVLSENITMLTMCRELGFAVKRDPESPSTNIVRLSLDSLD